MVLRVIANQSFKGFLLWNRTTCAILNRTLWGTYVQNKFEFGQEMMFKGLHNRLCNIGRELYKEYFSEIILNLDPWFHQLYIGGQIVI